MTKEIEYKEREIKIIEEENRKYETTVRNFEHKLKVLETGRNEALNKIQSLQEELNKIRKTYTDKEIEYENKINNLVLEKSTLQKNNSIYTSDNKKLLAEINIKESQVTKYKNDIYDLNKNIDQLSNNFTEKLEDAKGNYFHERKLWEREKNEQRIAVEELTRINENLKLKISKMESDDVKYAENLKKTFTKMIDDSFREKYKI